MLLANGLAQSQALMVGKTTAQALTEKAPTASKTLDAQTLARHRSFPGNRPSTTLLLDRLTPRSLGALIAMYEHRVFTSGALWGINSYDQWGVELGKALCADLLPRLEPDGDLDGLDASTAGLLQRLRSLVELIMSLHPVLAAVTDRIRRTQRGDACRLSRPPGGGAQQGPDAQRAGLHEPRPWFRRGAERRQDHAAREPPA